MLVIEIMAWRLISLDRGQISLDRGQISLDRGKISLHPAFTAQSFQLVFYTTFGGV